MFSWLRHCLDPLVTHLNFVDDVLIFSHGTEMSLAGIMSIWRRFHIASGLSLNLQKSCLIVDGNNLSLSRDIAARFGLWQGSLTVKYLGLPLLPHKLLSLNYQPLIDKNLIRISSWTVRHLSFVGRIQLIQLVLFNIFNFWTVVFPLPKGCLEALEKLCNTFLSSVAPNLARGAKIAWDSVSTLKKVGGLGLWRLEASNQVFALKIIWLLFANIGLLCVSWIDKMIIKGRLSWKTNF